METDLTINPHEQEPAMPGITTATALERIRAVVAATPGLSSRPSAVSDAINLFLGLDPDWGGSEERSDGLIVTAADGAQIEFVASSEYLLGFSGVDAGTDFLSVNPVTFRDAEAAHATLAPGGLLAPEQLVALAGGLGTQSIDTRQNENVTGLPIADWIDRWIPVWGQNHSSGDYYASTTHP